MKHNYIISVVYFFFKKNKIKLMSFSSFVCIFLLIKLIIVLTIIIYYKLSLVKY